MRKRSLVSRIRRFDCSLILLDIAFLLVTFSLDAADGDEPQAKSITKADEDLEQRWTKLKDVEAANLTRQHIQGLVRAMHAYIDDHGTFPPSVIPNPKLPAGKRLSGFVLLLPYLDAKLSYDKKQVHCFDPKVVKLAKKVYKSIDRTKAWDDPVNLKAAKTLIPAFLSPKSGSFRDENGMAVTHFAFVQGSEKGLDGAFPGKRGLKIAEIEDGTVNVLAVGQVIDDLGPWIAEGLSTARQVHAPTGKFPGTFGSRYHKSGCYFAFCDASSPFMIFDKKANNVIQKFAIRNDGDPVLEARSIKFLRNPFENASP